jgi:Pam16
VLRSLTYFSCPLVRQFQQYDRYMASNDPKKGGSFYLQSKVYRAKELLDEFQREMREEELQQQEQQQEQQQQQPPQQGEDGGTGGANR